MLRIIMDVLGQITCRLFRRQSQQEARFRRRLEGNAQSEQLRAVQKFSRENGMKRTRTSGQRAIARTGRFPPEDRKSTRLNSSHVSISYAVFCLKKKKITNI